MNANVWGGCVIAVETAASAPASLQDEERRLQLRRLTSTMTGWTTKNLLNTRRSLSSEIVIMIKVWQRSAVIYFLE